MKRGLKVRNRQKLLVIASVLTGVSLLCSGCAQPPEAQACSKLADASLDHAKVVEAKYVSSGYRIMWQAAFIGLPRFKVPDSCRVTLEITPTSDSMIKTKVWLPTVGWNGRLWGAGNGGLAGSIEDLQLTVALSRGYAVASTDTGHEGSAGDGTWALGHPEKIIDFGSRAIHETAMQAKVLIRAYYGHPQKYSYFISASNGGRAALMEAQRYPDDYDGIMAGAPANNGTNNIASMAWVQQQVLDKPGAWFSPDKLPAIIAAAMKECDQRDGLADGLIDDSRQCKPHPETLLCKGAESNECLTAPQVKALEAIYRGPGKSPDGRQHYGYAPGSESGWKDWVTGPSPRKAYAYLFALETYRYLVYRDPAWTVEKFNFAHDAEAADRILGPAYDAVDPDLTRFAAHGGKLILYHGWADPALVPELTIDYYEQVRGKMGGDKVASFVRLYMVPGLAHVFGGPGLNSFGQAYAPKADADPSANMVVALERWVEDGIAPTSIVAAKYDGDIKPLIDTDGTTVLRTRPLCPYPQVARWVGKGSIDAAQNFQCVAKPN